MAGYLFLDLETGGLDQDKHAIVQVAAIRTDVDLNIRGSFRSYIKPAEGLTITERATETHGLTAEMLRDEPSEWEIAQALQSFVLTGKNLAFAGFNCQFDFKFLEAWRKRHGLAPWPFAKPWLDIMLTAERELGLHKWPKLTEVAERFGINTKGAHDAAADILMTVQVARALRKRRKADVA